MENKFTAIIEKDGDIVIEHHVNHNKNSTISNNGGGSNITTLDQLRLMRTIYLKRMPILPIKRMSTMAIMVVTRRTITIVNNSMENRYLHWYSNMLDKELNGFVMDLVHHHYHHQKQTKQHKPICIVVVTLIRIISRNMK